MGLGRISRGSNSVTRGLGFGIGQTVVWRVLEQQLAKSPNVAVVEFDQALAVTRNNPHIYYTEQLAISP